VRGGENYQLPRFSDIARSMHPSACSRRRAAVTGLSSRSASCACLRRFCRCS